MPELTQHLLDQLIAHLKSGPRGGHHLDVSIDGDQWCVLLGPDLQSGTAGFGSSPEEALANLTLALNTTPAPEAHE